MSAKSAIEWTDATWNPVTGCTKVSPGCDHCYAETVAHRFAGTPAYPDGFKVTLRPDRIDQPFRWKRPRRIFVNSMSDLFHDAVPDGYITEVFDVMESPYAAHHTFQILTKRHARMRSFVQARMTARREYAEKFDHCPTEAMRNSPAAQWARRHAETPPANVWLGVSVEDQQWADIRIPALLQTPAAVRFLSCEPLLGPVRLNPDWLHPPVRVCGLPEGGLDPQGQAFFADITRAAARRFAGEMGAPEPAFVDWVITGGESGYGARPMHPAWARAIRDQCRAAGVPFFFKQWGEHAPAPSPAAPRAFRVTAEGGINTLDWPEAGDAVMWQAGKKAAGRKLDGRTWDEYPTDRKAG